MHRRGFLGCGLTGALAFLARGAVAQADGEAAAQGGEAAAPAARQLLAPEGDPQPFSAEILRDMARERASRGFEARPEVPAAWRNMSYDEYRAIWFDTDKALWTDTDLPFRLDGFAPGLYFPRAVDLFVVEDGEARALPFDLGFFVRHEYAPDDLPDDPALGYSGLRLRAELKKPGFYEEFFVMQGASYFRAIAPDETYGLSARGLAINTAAPGGEEFPEFVAFWIERPLPDQDHVIIHALLDSPSVAGAYRFRVKPGQPVEVDIRATLFARTRIEQPGLAPLTSMFLFDETNRDRFSDFRPAVHDSDGLLIENGAGEVLWRPLANPRELQISNFIDTSPRGFGLMQRARKFHDFADLEAQYHRRPSVWVQPGDDWGRGSVTLVEIPADREIYDNVVAFWSPEGPIEKGAELSLSWRLLWGDNPAPAFQVTRVLNTRLGANHHGTGYTVVIDFAPHPAVPEDLSEVEPVIYMSNGSPTDGVVQRNPETGGPRLSYHFDAGDARSIEFRVQLRRGDTPLSEVWLYRWTV